jgi:hypothetical protein
VIKELMRKIVIALVIAVLPTWAAAQETSRPPKHSKKPHTLHSASGNHPCAKYGVGFAKVAGSDTALRSAAALASTLAAVHVPRHARFGSLADIR